MKTLKVIGLGAFSVYCLIALDACSKTANSSTGSSASCVTTATGAMVNPSTGAACTTAGMTGICTNGYYTSTTGQVVSCTVGSPINTGYQTYYPAPNGYQGSAYPTGATTCAQYAAYYGVQYVPVNDGGAFYCVRYDVFQGYASQLANTNYGSYGYDYYYAYPPTIDSGYGGGGCSTYIQLDGIGSACF